MNKLRTEKERNEILFYKTVLDHNNWLHVKRICIRELRKRGVRVRTSDHIPPFLQKRRRKE